MPRRSNSTQAAIERGSGNAFADPGFPNAPENHAKVQLAVEINRLLDERRLTQSAAAKILGVGQPKVSALRNYRLAGFSLERLMRLMKTLGKEVQVVARGPRRAAQPRRGPRQSSLAWSRTPAGAPLNRSAKEKWTRLLAHVDEWMKDESGYDERVWPEILRGLNADRMSYRSRG